jgi:tRNA(Ile)-lysidine synthase
MLIERVRRAIGRYRLLERGDRVIVGVSAGVDSMVLLHILNALRQDLSLSLVIAHLNHGLRPSEADSEADLVRKESLRLGLPFEYRQFNVKELQKSGGFSLQDAARRIRFQFFHELCDQYGGGKIALGHQADDQVETILLRLMRGSGLKGIKGMLPIRQGRVIRPLLEVWRVEVENFAQQNSISYLTDSSNIKQDYLRNRLRLDLIPYIEKYYQPGFRRAILRTSTLLREEDDFIEQEAHEAYQKIARKKQEEIAFEFSVYQSLHPALQRRVLEKAIREIETGLSRDEIGGAEVNLIYRRLIQPRASFFITLSHGLCLEKRYDTVCLRRGMPKTILPFEVELQIQGRTYLKEIEKEVGAEEKERDGSEPIHESRNVAFLDYEKIHLPLKMRNFRPGDRFHPLGAKGKQKLKEFFIDQKIPKMERASIPLLVSGDMIAWVAGYRIDERFKLTPRTRKVLKVEIVER